MTAKLTHAPAVTRDYLAVCRQTAAGQYLDLQLSSVPLSRVTLFQTLKVAQLKTARYSFVAPLVAGARLAGAEPPMIAELERIGRGLGLCYQLQDDLIGLFGDHAIAGKPTDADFVEGKRTFPLIAAYVRSDDAAKAELEALWAGDRTNPSALARARELIVAGKGKSTTERVIARAHHTACVAIERLPKADGQRAWLELLAGQLGARNA